MADLSTIDQIDAVMNESEIVMDSNIDPDAGVNDSGVLPDEMIAHLLANEVHNPYNSKSPKK